MMEFIAKQQGDKHVENCVFICIVKHSMLIQISEIKLLQKCEDMLN